MSVSAPLVPMSCACRPRWHCCPLLSVHTKTALLVLLWPLPSCLAQEDPLNHLLPADGLVKRLEELERTAELYKGGQDWQRSAGGAERLYDLGTTPGGSHNPGVTGPLDENITAASDLPWALNEPLSACERAGVAGDSRTEGREPEVTM